MVTANTTTYGGDEVASLVLEIGSSTVRTGYAGEDTPRSVVSSYAGCYDNRTFDSESAMDVDGASAAPKSRWIAGDCAVGVPRDGMEIKAITKDGLINDWDSLECVLKHSVRGELGLQPQDFPLFYVEPTHNTPKHREKFAELAFESMDVPAMFAQPDAVMAAFAAGRSTALVVDIGASGTNITPVYEGFVLQGGARRSYLAGNALDLQVKHFLKEEKAVEITPRYRVLKKRNVDLNKPAEATFVESPQNITDSFHHYAVQNVIADLKENVLLVHDVRYNEAHLLSRPYKNYEFPDGFNTAFGTERYRLPEIFFDPAKYWQGADAAELRKEMALPQLILDSANSCDVDVRTHLLANIVITGGTSLLPGFVDRINNELLRLLPASRIKASAAPLSVERKFGAWIGGSVTASLGSFQQLWVSKSEYSEMGAAVIAERRLIAI